MDALPIAEIAAKIGGTLVAGDPATRVERLAGVEEAGPGDLTFYESAKFKKHALASKAAAMLVTEKLDGFAGAQVVTPGPYLAFTMLARELLPQWRQPAGAHATAVVARDAKVDASASIGAHAVVEAGATIGARVTVMAGAWIGPGAVVGDESTIHPHVVIGERSRIGKRCVIHAGTVIGEDGFGYRRDETGHRKIPHFGWVEVGDDVEMGANCAIARGTFGRTVIGAGSKLDNMVHIAHNVRVGERTLLIAQVAIAGGSKIGSDVIIAGQSGIADHADIGDATILGPRTGVSGRVKSGVILAGAPAKDHRDWVKWGAARRYLPGLLARVRKIEKKLGLERSDESKE